MCRLWWAFLRLFFRLLYQECAWAYDLVAWLVSLGQWKAWTCTALRHLGGRRVLELAHGPGHLLVAMAAGGLDPVGLDLSPYMGRLARKRLRSAGVAVPLVRARAQALPFCDGCFDSAVATFPTEFILAPTTLRETARVLRSPQRPPWVGASVQRSASPERSHGPPASGPAEAFRRGIVRVLPGGRLVIVAWVRFSALDPLSRFLAWLYRVTGQEGSLPGGGAMAEVERWFSPRVVWEQVGSAQVMVVVAEKR